MNETYVFHIYRYVFLHKMILIACRVTKKSIDLLESFVSAGIKVRPITYIKSKADCLKRAINIVYIILIFIKAIRTEITKKGKCQIVM